MSIKVGINGFGRIGRMVLRLSLIHILQNIMPQGYEDGFSHNVNYDDSFRQCLEAGKKYIDYDRRCV